MLPERCTAPCGNYSDEHPQHAYVAPTGTVVYCAGRSDPDRTLSVLRQVSNTLGPEVPTCEMDDGCRAEWAEALRLLAPFAHPSDRSQVDAADGGAS